MKYKIILYLDSFPYTQVIDHVTEYTFADGMLQVKTDDGRVFAAVKNITEVVVSKE